jgi:glycosyltransferase involved in cell wall biosynthesis
MLAAQPRETIPAYLSAADVALVPLRRLDIFKGALPSKIFDAWACECPIILSMQGEAQQVLRQANAGVYVEPESPSALAQTVQEMVHQRERLRHYGHNGRRFVEEHYSRQAQAQRLTRLLELLV